MDPIIRPPKRPCVYQLRLYNSSNEIMELRNFTSRIAIFKTIEQGLACEGVVRAVLRHFDFQQNRWYIVRQAIRSPLQNLTLFELGKTPGLENIARCAFYVYDQADRLIFWIKLPDYFSDALLARFLNNRRAYYGVVLLQTHEPECIASIAKVFEPLCRQNSARKRPVRSLL